MSLILIQIIEFLFIFLIIKDQIIVLIKAIQKYQKIVRKYVTTKSRSGDDHEPGLKLNRGENDISEDYVLKVR